MEDDEHSVEKWTKQSTLVVIGYSLKRFLNGEKDETRQKTSFDRLQRARYHRFIHGTLTRKKRGVVCTASDGLQLFTEIQMHDVPNEKVRAIFL